MSVEQTPGTSKRFPRYLMDQAARDFIDEMEARGLLVDVMNPAVGAVEVVVTALDGTTHCEMGRSEDLADTLQRVAAMCG